MCMSFEVEVLRPSAEIVTLGFVLSDVASGLVLGYVTLASKAVVSGVVSSGRMSLSSVTLGCGDSVVRSESSKVHCHSLMFICQKMRMMWNHAGI